MNENNENTKNKTIAAIDIGTNSFHLVIVELGEAGVMNVITRDKEMVRLGESGDEMKKLSEAAMQRGIVAIERFVKLANLHSAEIRAIATSAVREAQNNKDFIDSVKQRTGIEIEIVSGIEESRLAYLGVLYGIQVFDKHSLVIDIGGGSTETVIGFRGEMLFANSEKLGAIRLTQRFFKNEVNAELINQCRQYIAGKLTPVFTVINNFEIDEIIGTAGTIETVAFMAYLKKNKEISDIGISNNGFSISINGMLKVIEKIVEAQKPQAINELSGMDKKRADIILAGALIIEFILLELKKNRGTNKLLFSPYGLREGILCDTILRNSAVNQEKQPFELRKHTVENLAKKYNVNLQHAKFVEAISLKIFDSLNNNLFNFSHCEREILSFAALLHDIGYFISHNSHHQHSLYIIQNSDLPGFTNNDVRLIANIARYHRKSHPKKSHENYVLFSDKNKNIINILAGILRISEGIDRRRNQLVNDIILNFDVATHCLNVQIIPCNADVSVDMELWGANRRKLLLEETLEIEIKITL